jgi:hypothetical protein
MRLTDAQIWDFMQKNGQNPSGPRPKERKKRGNEESRSQCALIAWWASAHAGFGVPERLLFSIPNGGWRDPVGAAILKREGQRNGVPDLMLCVPRGIYHALFLEMKIATGVVSAEQKAFIRAAWMHNYAAHVAHSLDEAIEAITTYLNTKWPPTDRSAGLLKWRGSNSNSTR